MRKIVLLITIVMFSFFSVKGQEVLNKGDKMFNLGLGLVSSYGFIPSIHFSGEVGVIPTGDIGIVTFGGEAEYKMEVWHVDNYYYYGNYYDTGISNHLVLGGRAAWHLHVFNNPKYDLYAGASAGFMMISHVSNWSEYDYVANKWVTKHTNYLGGYGNAFVGARIMTSDSFGFFGELGGGGPYPISYMRIGLTFKM